MVLCHQIVSALNIFKPVLTSVYSKAVARNLVASRGLYLNNQSIQDAQFKITPSNLLDNKFVILRAGKDKILILLASN